MICSYIGIGANLGNAHETVERAIAALDTLPDTRLTAQSSRFSTTPIDADGSDYINAVAQIHTTLDAHALLHHLFAIEAQFGRQRPYPNAPRTLDLDLLLYGKKCIATPELTVPHPRMTKRAFALIPLLQIDPFIDIPGQGPAHLFVPDVVGQTMTKVT